MSENRNIKGLVLSSAIWKFAERILAQIISLVVSIIIARILDPNDYSVVSLVTIFFTFSQILIAAGLNTSLIQKKNADVKDYSTVFWISLIISILIYLLLFAGAPFIGRAYNNQMIVPVLRVMGLILPVNAVKSIYCANISANLQFRKFFFGTLGGTLVSAIVGISMALRGYGPWALVAQQMTNTIIDTLILAIITRIGLRVEISLERLKGLWKYGWKIFVTGIVNTTYSEVVPLFIGLRFSTADLSFYTKGKSFPNLISSTSTYTLSAVLFPALSKFQDDTKTVLQMTRRYMQVVSFVLFPLMFGMFAVSDNFVRVILTSKWMPAATYIRIFSMAYMFDVITVGNCETIKAIGRSDVFLIMEIIKKSLYLVIIGVFMYFSNSPQGLAWASIACNFVAIVVNSIPNIKLIGYKFSMLVYDLAPNFIIGALMCGVVYGLQYLPVSPVLCLILQVLAGGVFYAGVSILTRNKSFIYLLNIIEERMGKKEG